MGTLVGWSNIQSLWHLFCQPCCSVSVVGVASAAVSIGITWCWRADLVGLAGSHTLSSASTAGPSICGMLWKCAWLCTDQVDYTLHQGLSSSPQTQSSEFCIHPSWWGFWGEIKFWLGSFQLAAISYFTPCHRVPLCIHFCQCAFGFNPTGAWPSHAQSKDRHKSNLS